MAAVKSGMMKKILALALLAAPAMAQSAPVTVYYVFNGPNTGAWQVDQVMHAVLARPEFLSATKRDPRVLEVTILGKIDRDPGENSKGYQFSLAYWRAGEKLGESVEACRTDKVTDCADQLASDITSAAAIRH